MTNNIGRSIQFSRIKLFLIYGFFFFFPVLGPITPEFITPFGAVNSDMLWLFISAIFAIYVIAVNRHIVNPQTFITILLYYTFLLLNAFFSGYFDKIVKTEIALFISSAFFILLIDNLQFDAKDKKRLLVASTLLVLLTLVGSFLQYFVDNTLFVSTNTYYTLSKIDFQGFWRNGSIFDSLIQNQGGIFFIFTIFLFLNKKDGGMDYVKLFGLLSLLTIGFLTFTRYVIISQIFIVISFILLSSFRSAKSTAVILLLVFIFGILGFYYLDEIANSRFVQVRLFADVSGRTKDPLDFFSQYLEDQNLFVGVGVSSFNVEYFYGSIRRLHAGVWDLIFQAGLVGISLWVLVLYQIHKKAMVIKRYGGNTIYLFVTPVLFLINFTAQLTHFYYMGLLLIYTFMTIEMQILKVKTPSKKQTHA